MRALYQPIFWLLTTTSFSIYRVCSMFIHQIIFCNYPQLWVSLKFEYLSPFSRSVIQFFYFFMTNNRVREVLYVKYPFTLNYTYWPLIDFAVEKTISISYLFVSSYFCYSFKLSASTKIQNNLLVTFALRMYIIFFLKIITVLTASVIIVSHLQLKKAV